jgi:hypothetical protein
MCLAVQTGNRSRRGTCCFALARRRGPQTSGMRIPSLRSVPAANTGSASSVSGEPCSVEVPTLRNRRSGAVRPRGVRDRFRLGPANQPAIPLATEHALAGDGARRLVGHVRREVARYE